MGQAILTEVGRLALAEGTIDWDDLWMFLFVEPDDVDVETVAADLTAADFSGYAPQQCDFSAPAIDGSHRAVRTLTVLRFQHNGGPTPDTVEGWGIAQGNNPGDPVLVVKLFDEGPMTFAASGDFIDVPLDWRILQP